MLFRSYYLRRYSDNVLLARYIFSQNELVRDIFKDEYGSLLLALYGTEPERLFILASQSLRMGGWMEEATIAVEQALQQNPSSKIVLQEKKIIDNWISRIRN